MIHGAPKVVRLSVDLDEDLIQMTAPLRHLVHALRPLLSDLRSKRRPEPVPPEANRLVADVYATLMEQIFDVPQ